MDVGWYPIANERGFSLVEILMATVVGSVLTISYLSNVSSFARATNQLTEKVVAEAHAAELIDVYRGMSHSEFLSYLRAVNQVVSCPQIPGDFDRDGKVDLEDEAIYRSEQGQALPPSGFFRSDVDRDGEVDADDLSIYSRNFGKTSPCGLPTCEQLPGDFNRDGSVNADDNQNLTEEQREIWSANNGLISSCGTPTVTTFPSGRPHYRMCGWINESTDEMPINDPVVTMPLSSDLPNAKRSMKVEIVKIMDRTLNSQKCVDVDSEAAVPAGDEAYMITVKVAWGEPMQTMTIPMVLPGESSDSTSAGCSAVPYQSMLVVFSDPGSRNFDYLSACITGGPIGYDMVKKDKLCFNKEVNYQIRTTVTTGSTACNPVLYQKHTPTTVESGGTWMSVTTPGTGSFLRLEDGYLSLEGRSAQGGTCTPVVTTKSHAVFIPNGCNEEVVNADPEM